MYCDAIQEVGKGLSGELEVRNMFGDMVKGWFGGSIEPFYNDFVKALLLDDIDAMNEFMAK